MRNVISFPKTFSPIIFLNETFDNIKKKKNETFETYTVNLYLEAQIQRSLIPETFNMTRLYKPEISFLLLILFWAYSFCLVRHWASFLFVRQKEKTRFVWPA